MNDKRRQTKQVYPDARTGPLGQQHADYARPRHWAGKPDADIQSKLMFWGTVITIALFIFIVAYLAIFGKGRFL